MTFRYSYLEALAHSTLWSMVKTDSWMCYLLTSQQQAPFTSEEALDNFTINKLVRTNFTGDSEDMHLTYIGHKYVCTWPWIPLPSPYQHPPNNTRRWLWVLQTKISSAKNILLPLTPSFSRLLSPSQPFLAISHDPSAVLSTETCHKITMKVSAA